ncbi:MAG: hypothetical protein RLZZ269_1253 [Actinomycetota bacterium]|jgi:predicted GH43/DUF377 family glycosyl hydrolase
MTTIPRPDPNVLAVRTGIHMKADPSRVFARLFIPGQEDFGATQSRATAVLDRVLELDESEVEAALNDVLLRFGNRHDDIHYWLDLHAHRVTNRLDAPIRLSDNRWRLIGAYFTHEFSVEGAALTNPSVVRHPDQTDVERGWCRFAMSARCIGEGHRSSIGFRTGVVSDLGDVVMDPVASDIDVGLHSEGYLRDVAFRGLLESMGDLGENAQRVLHQLGDVFHPSDLEEQLNRLVHDRDTYRNTEVTAHHFRQIADRSYSVSFSADSHLSERVIWPQAQAEWRGMEDARFVEFDDPEMGRIYFATYTAFDGVDVAQQLLSTRDFLTFEITPVSGAAARGKGLAIFPRKVGGRFAALSRADRETNSITFSDHLEYWNESTAIQLPRRSWEVIQLGNCGSPIETSAGWLVMTHAVGPMRTYCISALLLDRHDPERVIGSLGTPLLVPSELEQDGYVPNVVYSCGSMRFENTLLIPFGIADQSIGVATAELDRVLDRLVG